MDLQTSLIAGLAFMLVVGMFLFTACVVLRSRIVAAEIEIDNNRQLIEHLSEGIYRSSADGRMISANPALVRLNGYRTERDLLASCNDIALEWYVEPDRRGEFRARLDAADRVDDFVSEIYRHKTRERIWISESARAVRNSHGRLLYYEGSVREITETMRRLKLEEQFQKLISHLPGGVFQIRCIENELTCQYLSPQFPCITGLALDVHLANPTLFRALVHDDDADAYERSWRVSAEKVEALDHEFRIRTPAGEEKWVRIVATPEATADGGVIWHGHIADVSLRKLQKNEIERLAYTDPLTELPNRRRFFTLLEQATARCVPGGSASALLYIDLDRFKAVNDTLGHAAGDRYLNEIGTRIRRWLGPLDIAARIGGDEFAVYLAPCGSDQATAARLAIQSSERLRSELALPYTVGTTSFASSASIGLAMNDDAALGPDEWLRRADVAMYGAKAAGGDRVALYSEDETISAAPEMIRLRA